MRPLSCEPVHKRYLNFLAQFALAVVVFLLTVPISRGQNIGTLTGVVTDRFDAVISDVLISLYSTDRVLQVNSDRNGRFEFAKVPTGTYELNASRAGFQTRKIEAIRIAEKGTETTSISLQIASQPSDCGKGPSATYASAASNKPGLIGIVRDYAQGPVAGFKIHLLRVGATRVVASGRSNGKGEFQFRDVEPGQYLVRASHQGSWMARSEIFWITRENITRIVLDPMKRGSVILCQ